MNRVIGTSVCLLMVTMVSACTHLKPSKPPGPPGPKPVATWQGATSEEKPGELPVGQATGTYTAKGEVVELKYAYAGKAERFGEESMVILLTDKPIPPDAVAEEIKSQKLLLAESIRGLEYVIDKNGMWVRFHPSQYQESSGNK